MAGSGMESNMEVRRPMGGGVRKSPGPRKSPFRSSGGRGGGGGGGPQFGLVNLRLCQEMDRGALDALESDGCWWWGLTGSLSLVVLHVIGCNGCIVLIRVDQNSHWGCGQFCSGSVNVFFIQLKIT